MSKAAKAAQVAFTRLAGTEPASARFDDFLVQGISAFPRGLRARFEGLSSWHGLSGLKAALRKRAGASGDLPVLLANRSTQLMRLAARLLFLRTKRVLVTDLEWPAYRGILECEAKRTGGEVKEVFLREAVFQDRITANEVVSAVTEHYLKNDCGGMFLSGVTFDGVKLPVKDISRELSQAGHMPFVTVDGAQAFCHAPSELGEGYCDFYLAGCHKWLGAYHPMGVGFCGRERSEGLVMATLEAMTEAAELDDPLLNFTTRRECGMKEQFTETVSLGPLFSSAASLAENLDEMPLPNEGFARLQQNRACLEDASIGTSWSPLAPHESLRSGILLLQARSPLLKREAPEAIRGRFQERGITLTAYEGSVLRLSAQRLPLSTEERSRLRLGLTVRGNEPKTKGLDFTPSLDRTRVRSRCQGALRSSWTRGQRRAEKTLEMASIHVSQQNLGMS